MANVKLGNKTFNGVSAVKLDTTDGGTVVFEEPKGGGVEYVKFNATPAATATFTINNPLGGIARIVSVKRIAGATANKIYQYLADSELGTGVMNVNGTRYSSRITDGSPGNGQFAVSDGVITLKQYSAANTFDTSTEYEIEIWQ